MVVEMVDLLVLITAGTWAVASVVWRVGWLDVHWVVLKVASSVVWKADDWAEWMVSTRVGMLAVT